MILYRYLAREIITSTLAVSSILLLVILGSRFARYLGRAASGRLSLDSLGQLTFLYLPYAAQMILPISFILAVMMTFGRLYMESEMAVIQSSGVSQRKLLKLVLGLGVLLTLVTGFSSLYLTPLAQLESEKVIQEQQRRTGFESLTPGQFVELGDQAVYAEAISDDQQTLQRVFIAQGDESTDQLAVARRGFQQLAEETQSRFLILEEGYRYELPLEDLSMTVLDYERYALRLGVYQPPTIQEEVEAMFLSQLLASDALAARVELQWRLALPVMVLIMVLVAFPLTKVNPRQGRFMTLLPVLFLQMIFLTGVMSLQDTINKGQWPLYPGLWAVHAGFLLLGLLLCWCRGVFAK
ncbi:LPS export ABC transporter permease LptF [Marinospirillum perlucidum]|uniref:LPS export ABC transporter permease LptF n=1 Tax=Marinospirillum perlucidum TaxID=1982602 RepID=UPI0013901341|nr:LPS export ABC transporter permease LptF [Marinospirillum perlucidum]